MMKKVLFRLLLAALLISSCGTAGQVGARPGAMMAGAAIGGNVGGAIGGIVGSNSGRWNGGWRGSSIGSLVGTIAGAAIGGAASAAVAQKQQEAYEQQMNNQQRMEYSYNQNQSYVNEIPAYNPLNNLIIENLRFIDDNRNKIINPDESSKIIFEIYNDGENAVYDIIPEVQDLSNNKAISISPSVMIEKIEPGQGFRYTATLYAGKKLKDSTITIRVMITNQVGEVGDWQEFSLQAQKN